MSDVRGPMGWLSRRAYPRLAVLVVLGAAVGLLGTALVLLGSGGDAVPGPLGLRLAVVGYLLFLFGATGYVAFAVFSRGFD